MPTYEYRCPDCGHDFEKRLRISEYNEPQTCPECDHHPADKRVSSPQFLLKGDDWAGKNLRIKGQMEKKNQRLKSKEEDRRRGASVRLAPNVDGERVDSWSDAKKLAQAKGKDTSGYERMEQQTKALEKKPGS